MNMNEFELKKSLLSTPGATIQETIDEIGMSQKELAERMGRTPEKLNELIQGKQPITMETASRLEYVLGIPASFWLNLERQYQDELLEIKKLEFLQTCKDWIRDFPLGILKKMGILPDTRKKDELIEPLLKFFRVASPKEWDSLYCGKEKLAFKIDLQYTAEPKSVATWLRYGEIQAEKLEIETFNKKKITENLDLIKQVCYKGEFDWMKQLQVICASFGVALVFSPCISKAPIYGASRWIKNGTLPVIQITDRRKDYASFWFTFYHELGHIRYHPKSETFISGKAAVIKQDEQKEEEANSFAERMFFTRPQLDYLEDYYDFYPELITELSEKIKVHPSIIIAHLQREGKISYKSKWANDMRKKIKFETKQFAPLSKVAECSGYTTDR